MTAMILAGRMATPPEKHDPVRVHDTSLRWPGHGMATAQCHGWREPDSTWSRSSIRTSTTAQPRLARVSYVPGWPFVDGGDADGGEIADGEFLVSAGYCPVAFELADAALDGVALLRSAARTRTNSARPATDNPPGSATGSPR